MMTKGSDPVLDDVIEEVANRLQAGEPVDAEAILARYPERADSIRRLLPAIEVMAEFGVSASRLAARGMPAGVGPLDTAQALGVLGDFRILREVGRGGMGVVYEAEQMSLGRRVALKVLPFAGALDAQQLRRFQTEARAAAQLHHTNIVPVFWVGCEQGVHYYAMQFIEGRTLADVIRELRELEGIDASGTGFQPVSECNTDKMPVPLNAGRKSPALGIDAPEDLPRPTGEKVAEGQVRGSDAGHADQDPADHSSELSAPAHQPSRTGLQPVSQSTTGKMPEPLSAGSCSPDPTEGPLLPHADRPGRTSASSTRNRAYFRNAARLGVEAAEALEHAHQEGIIHRDIKPANLMVDAIGHLWVTDFGLARLQSDNGLTITGDLLGTLRYMSPEQALGNRVLVDARTDVYSLGVTLYELVALQPSFEGRDRQELLRRIADEEPRSPRKLNGLVPREFETIILKAMAKEPASRYQTAQELADDLGRFLEDKPIRARRLSLLERAAKWSRRHKPLLGSAIVVLVMAVISLAIATALVWSERTRTESAYQAEAAQRKLLAINLDLALKVLDEIYVDMAEKHLRSRPGIAPEDEKLLRKALAFYEQFAAQNDPNQGAQFAAASAHGRVGDILGSLGDHAKAKEEFDRAIAGLVRVSKESPGVPSNEYRLAEVYGSVSSLLSQTGRPREAMGVGREASAILQKLVDKFPGEARYRYGLALNHLGLGSLLKDAGLPRESAEAGRHAISILEHLVEEHPQEATYGKSLSHAYNVLGVWAWTAGRNREAADAYRKALAVLVGLGGDNPSASSDRESLAALYHNLSVVLGPAEMALKEDYVRRAIRLREQLAIDLPNVPEHQNWLANGYDKLGLLLNQQGQRQRADQASLRALEIREALAQRFPEVPSYQATLGMALHNRALILKEPGELAEARRLFERAILQERAALKSNPANPVWRQWLRNHYHSLLFTTLNHFGAHQEAARGADELAKVSPIQWRDQLLAAHILIGCVAAAEADASLSPPSRESTARSYRDRADRLLDDSTGLISSDIPALKELASDLANCNEIPRFRNPGRAVALATKAAEQAPGDAQCWLILGVAQYRSGAAKEAIDAIEKSVHLNPGGDAYGWFFLAMAWWQKGEKAIARSWYDKAVQWMERNQSHDAGLLRSPQVTAPASSLVKPYSGSQHEELLRLRAESAALLGVTDRPNPTGKKEEHPKQRSTP
jgi:serine/threonine protein kinase/Tfp pilus assembly protein PilF